MSIEETFFTKKIKVLYVLHGLAPGGIEAFVLNVMDNIDTEKFEISFALATYGKQFYEDRVLESGIKIFKTSDLNGFGNILRHFTRLIKVIKQKGPFDVVHSNVDFMNGVNILAAFIAKVPKRISHSHNTNSANASDVRTSHAIKSYRYIMKTLIKLFSTHLLGCSGLANDYMYGYDWQKNIKAAIIYNGINLEKYCHRDSNLNDIKNELNLSSESINIITVGRMCEQKNSLFIIDIVNELFKIRKNIKFLWIGGGPLENKIKAKVSELGLNEVFCFLGNRQDVPTILKACNYYLFPSLWEGLPVSLIEAQASGLTCFVSDTITREADVGLCKVISLRNNANSWAIQINQCIDNNLFIKINDKKLKNFDIKNTVKDLEKIYLSE